MLSLLCVVFWPRGIPRKHQEEEKEIEGGVERDNREEADEKVPLLLDLCEDSERGKRLDERPFSYQIRTTEYWLILVLSVVTILWFNYYLGTIEQQMAIISDSPDQGTN